MAPTEPPLTLEQELSGSLPTPVRRLAALERTGLELWLKDDGLSGQSYGGNKLRKLGPILSAARARGCRRIVTVGATGSHHVLATTLFGSRCGLAVAAAIFPQPVTPHVAATFRCAMSLGLEPIPAKLTTALPLLKSLVKPGDYLVGPGAMGVLGSHGFAEAAHELKRQVDAGALPTPELIAIAVGSGSSIAGLAVGLLECGLESALLGVCANQNPLIRPTVSAQAKALARARGWGNLSELKRFLRSSLRFERRFVGPGYGHPTAAAEIALRLGAEIALPLEMTYTAKALAATLSLGRREAPRRSQQTPLRLLFWNTVSGIPLEPLLARAPNENDLPAVARQLLRSNCDSTLADEY